MESITIISGGSWGTALAQTLSKNNNEILLYVRDKKLEKNINQKHFNSKYFPEQQLSDSITATTNLKKSVIQSDIIFLSIPTDATRNLMTKIKSYLNKNIILISTAKGIEENNYKRNSEIIRQYCDNQIAVLSGPTHAEEVINELPTAAVIASKNESVAKKIQNLIMSRTFRAYTNTDVVGVELGGAVKNIIAIAAGIADGLGYGDNTRAALITRGLSEMRRLGIYMGGNALTFSGLTGMGDLVVTCNSMHSRNRRFGINIGQGMSFKKAKTAINQTVEGINTTNALYQWFKKLEPEFELPITTEIYQVLFNDKKPITAVDDLMLREPKNEHKDVNELL